MANFSGSYTVGTGGDYTKWSDAIAALDDKTANGNITFTQISTITETASNASLISSSFNLNGYTLKCLGNFGTVSGNYNSAYKLIDKRTDEAGTYFQATIKGSGTQIYSGLILIGTHFRVQNSFTNPMTVVYQDCMVSGIPWINSNQGGYGWYFLNPNKTIQMSNCIVYGDNRTGTGIRVQNCASATIENCSVYRCATDNVLIDAGASGKVSLRNIISISGDCYDGIGNTVYSGCASSNTTGNAGLTNLTNAVWSSVDPTNSGFMRLAASNGLGYSGVLTLLTENNHGIARNARPHGSYYSIGVDEATWDPPVTGFTKKVAGVITYSKINGVSKANISKLNGVSR